MLFKIFIPILFLGIWFYLRKRIKYLIILPFSWPKWIIYFCDCLIVSSGLFRYFYRYHDQQYYTSHAKNLFYIGYLSMALLAYVAITFLVIDCYLIIKKVYIKYLQANPVTNRRHFLKNSFKLTGVGVATLSLTGQAIANTSRAPLKRQELFHPLLPESFDGYKIAQISDLHLGPIIDRAYLQNVCDKLTKESPNIFTLTGDMIDGHVHVLNDQLTPLTQLKAPDGKFFVTGNHEYYWNAEEWINLFQAFGFQHLLNSNIILQKENQKILLAGVPDSGGSRYIKSHQVEMNQAIENNIVSDFKVLLAHRPHLCEHAADVGFNLQLSGHTHGGQSFPFNLFVGIVQKYLAGIYTIDQLLLYVSTGTGFWGPPIRLGISSEATIITLRKGPFSANTSGTFHS